MIEVCTPRECIAIPLTALKPTAETAAEKLSAIQDWRSTFRERVETMLADLPGSASVDEVFAKLQPAAAEGAREDMQKYGAGALQEIKKLETALSEIKTLHAQHPDKSVGWLVHLYDPHALSTELCDLLQTADDSTDVKGRIAAARTALQNERATLREILGQS